MSPETRSDGPKRIQLRRTRGWRKPEGAVVVSRPSRWGNPYRWTDYNRWTSPYPEDESFPIPVAERRRFAVIDFRAAVLYEIARPPNYPPRETIRAELAGRDLACWCPLDQPCHADVLLEIANSPGGGL